MKQYVVYQTPKTGKGLYSRFIVVSANSEAEAKRQLESGNNKLERNYYAVSVTELVEGKEYHI